MLGYVIAAFIYTSGVLFFVATGLKDRDPFIGYRFHWRVLAWPLTTWSLCVPIVLEAFTRKSDY